GRAAQRGGRAERAEARGREPAPAVVDRVERSRGRAQEVEEVANDVVAHPATICVPPPDREHQSDDPAAARARRTLVGRTAAVARTCSSRGWRWVSGARAPRRPPTGAPRRRSRSP